MAANGKVEQPALHIQVVLNGTFRDCLTCSLTLGDNNVSCTADTEEIAFRQTGAASCHQIITPSTSGGLKVTVCSLFMIPKCQRLWDISSCKLKSVSHFLS